MTPPAILDPIITTLAPFYQTPECLDPLHADADKGGVQSEHRIVIAKALDEINNKNGKEFRKIKVRPIPESGVYRLSQPMTRRPCSKRCCWRSWTASSLRRPERSVMTTSPG